MSKEISNMTCDGCGSRPIVAVLAVVQGKVACCPDCNTLDWRERNQLREAISPPAIKVTDERDAEIERLRKVMAWACGRDAGISSKAIVSRAVGIELDSNCLKYPPSDESDRGRCIRALQQFPWAIDALKALMEENQEWANQGAIILNKLSVEVA